MDLKRDLGTYTEFMWFRTGARSGMFWPEERPTIGVTVTHFRWKMSPVRNYYAEYTSNGPRPPFITNQNFLFDVMQSELQTVYLHVLHIAETCSGGPCYWFRTTMTQCINTTSIATAAPPQIREHVQCCQLNNFTSSTCYISRFISKVTWPVKTIYSVEQASLQHKDWLATQDDSRALCQHLWNLQCECWGGGGGVRTVLSLSHPRMDPIRCPQPTHCIQSTKTKDVSFRQLRSLYGRPTSFGASTMG
jgi:hypothetical protein